MARIFDGRTDIMMTLDGDLVLSSNGDLLLTSGFDWLAREVNKIVRTVNPEWQAHPQIGANIEQFGGRENSREVGLQIQRQLKAALDRSDILEAGQSFSVRVVPTDLYSVGVVISVSGTETSTTLSKLIFNFQNGTIADIQDIPASTATEDDGIHRRPKTNEIRHRLRKRKR